LGAGGSPVKMSTSAASFGTPTANRKALALDLKRSSTKVDFSRERSFVQVNLFYFLIMTCNNNTSILNF
jgi:hypothetical protein